MGIDLKELVADSNRRSAERRQRFLDLLANDFPDLEIDERKLNMDVVVAIYQIDNMRYIKLDYAYGAYLRYTDLYYDVDWLDRYYGGKYKTIELGSRLLLVSDWDSCLGADVKEYWNGSGKRIKGKRRRRAAHQSTKGTYIELNGKRHYL